ncbi:unnamed protein product [Caenorhabditis auriculariae]|uniref:Uncharacterized protein n=1 Tax=Caenorhabditis auriculariae TaxID=2777116 RepID=A0A8S1HUX0_9PELO|nr:unnamed protein product [Caenorhabditis auriculariae]
MAPKSRFGILDEEDYESFGLEKFLEMSFQKRSIVDELIGDDSEEGVLKTMKFLASIGMIMNFSVCACGNMMRLVKNRQVSDFYVWRCKSGDRHKVVRTVRKNSWLRKCHQPMRTLVRLAAFWSTERNSSASDAGKQFGLSATSVFEYYKVFRSACQHWCRRTAQNVVVPVGPEDLDKENFDMSQVEEMAVDRSETVEFKPRSAELLFRLVHREENVFSALFFELTLICGETREDTAQFLKQKEKKFWLEKNGGEIEKDVVLRERYPKKADDFEGRRWACLGNRGFLDLYEINWSTYNDFFSGRGLPKD